MNATQWETLTEFVKWLGREGKCVVDETEKGWFVAYIDRDPAAIAALESKAKKEKMDKDDQVRILWTQELTFSQPCQKIKDVLSAPSYKFIIPTK